MTGKALSTWLLLVTSSLGGACTRAAGTTSRDIVVLAPLSGPEAGRGDATLRAAVLMNERLAASGRFSPPLQFKVIDSNVTPERLLSILSSLGQPQVLLAGGCNEVRTAQAFFTEQAPLLLALFCDHLPDRAAVEREDVGVSRVFWLGPPQVTFLRGLSTELREQSDPGLNPTESNPFTAYSEGTVVVATEPGESSADVLRAVDDLGARGFVLHTEVVPASNITATADYTGVLKNIRDRSVELEHKQQLGFTYLLAPWLSTAELMRQARVVFGATDFARFIYHWTAPMDYQVDDPQRGLAPLAVGGLNILTQFNQVNVASLRALDSAMQSRYGTSGRALLTRVAVDAFVTVALTLAPDPEADAETLTRRFLAVTDKVSGDTTFDFGRLDDALASAASGAPLDYDGVFSPYDRFDAFGQPSLLRTSVRRLVFNGDIPTTVIQNDVFADPLEGHTLDLNHAVTRGCLTAEPVSGSSPWRAAGLAAAYDRSVRTGVVPPEFEGTFAGVLLRFAQPVKLTGLFFQHFKGQGDVSIMETADRLRYWSSPPPMGFDPKTAPADGELSRDWSFKGPWFHADWSFDPPTVSAVALLSDYRNANGITENAARAPERSELFSDLMMFLSDESSGFCP